MNKKKIVVLIGWAGTILLILAYALNSFGFLKSTGVSYASMNLLAAVMLGVRVAHDKNWSNLFLEFFWASVALVSIARSLF